MELTLLSSLVVSALFASEPAVKPAGEMVIVLPIELFTLAILFSTARCATSIVRLRPILNPKIATMDVVRTPLRNALRIPLLTGFMLTVPVYVILYADYTYNNLHVCLSFVLLSKCDYLNSVHKKLKQKHIVDKTTTIH
jgi:hypothetical protein